QFDNLFIAKTRIVQPDIHHALYEIVSLNKEQIFRDTLKRCCYILINNWSAKRNYQLIHQLILLFSHSSENERDTQTWELSDAGEETKKYNRGNEECLSPTSDISDMESSLLSYIRMSGVVREGDFTQGSVKSNFQPPLDKNSRSRLRPANPNSSSGQRIRPTENTSQTRSRKSELGGKSNPLLRSGHVESSPHPLRQNAWTLAKQRLNKWLHSFLCSEDYQELYLFFSKYTVRDKSNWSNRYASYLLTSQALDFNKPKEQREAARVVSTQLKEQFKFDLAMYTARSQLAITSAGHSQNPTVLGDDVLHLIRRILSKRKRFSYKNLANIFLKQTNDVSFKRFKIGLVKYLTFYLEDSEFINVVQQYLSEYVESLYIEHDREKLSSHLLLRTCNRIIEYLTTQNQGNPSQVFTLLALQGESLILAILLIKIILICKSSYLYLETCLAYLIQYYQDVPESDCQWLIVFLETIRITLMIYAEDIRYNLLSVKTNLPKVQQIDTFSSYRIFSQVKRRH
ncbi:MAG TPA: hypothetical protein V6C91_16955, partial [Coleofasciculaceae cyanobacterium]